MKALLIITAILFPMFLLAEGSVFKDFMDSDRSDPSLAELRDFPTAYFDELPTLPDGKKVTLEKVIMLSPAGLRFMGENGPKTIPFKDLPSVVKASTGWTPEIAAAYDHSKSVQGAAGSMAAAKAREDAAKKENQISAKNAEDSKPKLIIHSARDKSGLPARVAANIHADAEKKWKDNFEMQNYEVEEATAAYWELQAFKHEGFGGVPNVTFQKIVKTAEKKWGDNYEMVCFEIKEQCAAFVHRQ